MTTQSPRIRTAIPGPRSQGVQARRDQAVARGVSSLLPVAAERGGDGVLTDTDGNDFVDLGSGIAVTTVGNPAPAVAEAAAAQARSLIHTCFMAVPYEGYVGVCEQLNQLTPGDHDKRSALFTTGAEAVENAIKVARHASGRSAVVVFDHAYHGRTNLTLALTAKNMPYKHRFGPFSPEVYRVPASYPFRDPDGMSGEEAAQRAITAVEAQVGTDNVAAVLVEPIQGEGGFVVPAPGFLQSVANWCSTNGVLLVADEIQTGFCRTGRWFASEHEGIAPDLVITAKGMAGGFPLSAVTGRAEVMDAVHTGGLGGTFAGNPVACAAALATIDQMRQGDLPARARQIEDTALPRLRGLATKDGGVGEARGRGAMLAVEFVDPGSGAPDPQRATQVATRCHQAGVIVLTCGTHGNVVRLLPPLVIPDHLLEVGLSVLEEAVTDP